MAGVRQFNEGKMFENVVQTFWQQGYEATTMADLAKATGIQRGSLYNAYNDKETLLLKALDYYATEKSQAIRKALEDPNPLNAISRFFDAHMARLADPQTPHGCLATNSCLECSGRYPNIEKKIAAQFQTTEQSLFRLLQRAQRQGQLTSDEKPRALARFFLASSRAMAVMHKAYGGNMSVVKDVAKTALVILQSNNSAKLHDQKS